MSYAVKVHPEDFTYIPCSVYKKGLKKTKEIETCTAKNTTGETQSGKRKHLLNFYKTN